MSHACWVLAQNVDHLQDRWVVVVVVVDELPRHRTHGPGIGGGATS